MTDFTEIAETFFGGSKRKRNLCKTAIVISSIDAQVHVALYIPILALIMQSFPGQESTVNFAFSVTSGFMVVFIFVSGFLARYFDKRNLMLLGTFVFIVGGLCSSFAPTAEVLVITRPIEGIGAGLVYPMVPAITSQIFKGEERTALMGYTNSGSCAVTFVLNILAGVVGRLCGWRACLLMYGILIIVLIMQILYIPKMGPEGDLLRRKKASGSKIKIPKQVFFFTLCFFGLNTFGAAYQMILPVHVITTGIGDSVLVGTASSLNVFVGVVMGVLFGRIVKTFKSLTPALSLFLMTAAYVVWAFAQGAFMVYLGAALLGCCYGIMIPYFTEGVARVTTDDNVTFSMTILTAFGSLLGFFCINFLVNFLNSITGSNAMMEFLILGGVFAVAFIATLIGGLLMFKKRQQEG